MPSRPHVTSLNCDRETARRIRTLAKARGITVARLLVDLVYAELRREPALKAALDADRVAA